MKIFWALAIFAFAVLGAAAVWLGGLNQDEGWYLYAADLVAEGKMLYKDFFYTQGPFMPRFYGSARCVWDTWGLLGARILTLTLGFVGICFATGLARRLAPEGRKVESALITFLLLGCNLYHLYYVAIPKTYALASMLVMMGFFLVAIGGHAVFKGAAGLCLAYAAGTRISLGALLCVVGLWLLLSKRWKDLLWFCIGGFCGLAGAYLPYLCDPGARAGLVAAQQYHAARGGFDLVWSVGSLSRLVRWYLPVFVVLGLGVAGLFKSQLEVEQRNDKNSIVRSRRSRTRTIRCRSWDSWRFTLRSLSFLPLISNLRFQTSGRFSSSASVLPTPSVLRFSRSG